MKGDFFHICNRGVDKRQIFYKKEDNLRFIHNLKDLNNKNLTLVSYKNRRRNSEIVSPKKEEELVDILFFSLLSNHYHSFVREKIDGGAGEFARKINIAYTMHFNSSRKRSGVLFQGKTKIILIKHDEHFRYLPFYIFANPLNLFQQDWREKGIKDPKKAFEFLINYPWSSFSEILSPNQKTIGVINKELFFKSFDTNQEYFKKDFMEWLKNYKEGYNFGDFAD